MMERGRMLRRRKNLMEESDSICVYQYLELEKRMDIDP